MHTRFRFICLLPWLFVHGAAGAAAPMTADQHLTQLMVLKNACIDAVENAPNACPAAVRYFRTHLWSEMRNLENRTTPELRLLLRSVAQITVYAPEKRYSRVAVRIGRELERRDALRPADARMGAGISMLVRDSAILGHRGPWASALRHAGTPTLPVKRRDGELWTLQADGTRLLSMAVDWSRVQLVISAHPSCSKAVMARDAMTSDPRLRAVLQESHAIWLAPPDTTIDFSAYRHWNVRTPDQPLLIAATTRGLSGMADGLTPVFHFLRDGRVVARVVGWPSPAQADVLLQAWEDHTTER